MVPPPAYISELRDICDRHDVLMIADEIQSGLCRTGKMFSFEYSDVVPDIVTMSKALGGVGLPISGMAYKEELDTWPPGKHIGTFRGNVTAYVAGAVALNFMVESDLPTHVTKIGGVVLEMLKELEQESAIVGEVRGKGLMLGVELVKDKETKEPAPDFAKQVRAACHKRGLLIEVGGHFFNVARFLPPLVITEDLAKKGVEVFAGAVKEVESKT
ncbi:MAG: Diaminobutyrate--2-oxoglutarate aminotransferase [Chloroflexi bacterium]|nr:Diaminobutyrate--2-oxoglutarate aminotransferase [Chloroflexota bacterium]